MERTPIKIRGKRTAQTTGSRTSVASILNSDASKAKLPLPPRSTTATPPAKIDLRTTFKSCKQIFTKCSSPFEQLPAELLETIFFYSLNINLPLSSPFIGHKLNSTRLRNRLVVRTLSAPGSLDYPCELATIFPTAKDHAKAQSAILRQRWLTLPLLKNLIPDYIVHTIIRELGARKLQWMGVGPVVFKESEPVIRQFLQDNARRFEQTRSDGSPPYWEVMWGTKSPSQQFVLGINLRDGLVTFRDNGLAACTMNNTVGKWRLFCGAFGCQIPEKLLHGPWTDEKCEFLEIAIQGNAQVDWVDSTSGEVAEEGLMQAIQEHNARAARALVARVGSGPLYPGSMALLTEPVKYAGRDLIFMSRAEYADIQISRGVGIVPRQEHLRKAVLEEDCPPDVIEALLAAAEGDFDFNDPLILDWIYQRRQSGDARSVWLYDKLKEGEDRQSFELTLRRGNQLIH